MEGELKLVVDKQKCDKTKQQLKRLLIQLDPDKSGCIKTEAFETVLGLHNVRLPKEGIATLLRECKPVTGAKTGLIDYREALQRITINMEVDEPMMKEWIVRSRRTDGKEYSPIPTVMRSSYSKSASGGMSTNKMMKQLNTIIKTHPDGEKTLVKGEANSRSMERVVTPTGAIKSENKRYSSVKPKAEANNNEESESFVAAKLKFFDTELDQVNLPPKQTAPERDVSPTLELIKGGRGRSPGKAPRQPTQKTKDIQQFNYDMHVNSKNLPSYQMLRERNDKLPKWFDEGGDKIRLHTLFAHDNRTSIPLENKEPTYDDLKIGVKVYDDRKQQKNMNSVDDYHMISNLSN